MYLLLDKFFLVFHSSIIIFNLSGWAWKKTRRANLVLLLLTAFSWLVLGIWHGIGYCPCTDWHWRVLEKMGREGLPASYVKYLLDQITGLDFNARLVDTMTAILFVLALAASVYTNVRDYKRRDA